MYIVNDFYTNPDLIRNYAISMQRESESKGNYAGVMTDNSFLTQEHIDIIGQLVGHKVSPNSPFTGKFRFTKKNDKYNQDIHFDTEYNGAWAGLVYLTPNIEDKEGTIFWKHKRTGLESIPRKFEEINQYGWKDIPDLATFLNTEGIDHSYWVKTLTIPYRYNRLVLFRPWMFHSPGPAFGDKIEDCRLIQTFFWSPG
jgi:hypothetical protein